MLAPAVPAVHDVSHGGSDDRGNHQPAEDERDQGLHASRGGYGKRAGGDIALFRRGGFPLTAFSEGDGGATRTGA
jgi:hypothetical protein